MVGRYPAAIAALAMLWGCAPEVVIGRLHDDDRDAATEEPLPEISWLSGAHVGTSVASYEAFARWRGRQLDIAHVFVDRLQGWPGLVTPSWPVDLFRAFAGTLMLSMPLYPSGEGNNRDCARGDYDTEWRKLGAFLVERGRAESILRLGWGPYDREHYWQADSDPSDYVACFRRVVSAVRERAPRVRIDWSFDAIGAPTVAASDPYAAYPGDAYVDYIGIELFDRYPAVQTIAAWDDKCAAPTGLCSAIRFTRSRGKRVGIAEWGVVGCGAEGGGDSAFFVQRAVATFAANRDVMAYDVYYDERDETCSSLLDAEQNPRAAARYLAVYGPR